MNLTTPRKVSFATMFFKTISGLGVGLVGMVVLLVFVFLGIGTTKSGGASSPFFVFTSVVMGLTTSLVTNMLGVFLLSKIDRSKLQIDIRAVLQHTAVLNILIFICMLPLYLIAVIQGTQAVMMTAAFQLLVSAQASLLAFELISAEERRERLLSIYSVSLAMMTTIALNAGIYSIVDKYFVQPSGMEAATTSASGATALLFFVLPLTWMLFGFFTSCVEMVYAWIHSIWGTDYLNRD